MTRDAEWCPFCGDIEDEHEPDCPYGPDDLAAELN